MRRNLGSIECSIVLVLAACIASASGCAADVKSCPTPTGAFQFQYSYMSGTCDATPTSHPIELRSGTNDVTRSGDKVKTEVIYKGCDISVDYRVDTIPDDTGVVYPISRVIGEMTVESEEELSGVVTRFEYDPLGAPVCQGEYEAVISKQTSTVGAATD